MTEIIDTTVIQMQSVFAFAQALGYEYNKFPLECKGFYSRLPANRHRANVSFNSMVKWHNTGFMGWHGKPNRDPWCVDSYTFVNSQAAKIVRVAKLIHNKRTNTIRCQSFIVEFSREGYAPLFLPTIYEND
jgi:hypothetical protein